MSGFTDCPGPPQCTRCVVISADVIAERYSHQVGAPPPPPPKVSNKPVKAKTTNWKTTRRKK